MATNRPPYPPEFRAEAIALVRSSGKSQRAIAEDLGISTETLRQWLKQHPEGTRLDAGVRHDGLTTSEREELARLRRENRILREEREILTPKGHPAAAFFAREDDSRR
jgi:transposase